MNFTFIVGLTDHPTMAWVLEFHDWRGNHWTAFPAKTLPYKFN